MLKIALMMMSALSATMALTADSVSKVPAGTISRISGAADSVLVSGPRDSDSHPARQGDSLNTSDVLTTDKDQTVTVSLLDGSELVIAPDTKFTVDTFTHPQIPRKTIFSLVYGTVRALVKRIYTGEDRFVIKAPRGIMGVRGTHFIVTADRASGDTELHVLEGKVAMSLTLAGLDIRTARVLVPAGKSCRVSADSPTLSKPQAFDREGYRTELRALSPDFENAIEVDAPAPQPGDGARRRTLQDALQTQHAQDRGSEGSDPRNLRAGAPIALPLPGIGSPGMKGSPAAGAINPNPLLHPGPASNPPGATNSRPTVGAGATPPTQTPPNVPPKTTR